MFPQKVLGFKSFMTACKRDPLQKNKKAQNKTDLSSGGHTPCTGFPL